MPLFFFEDDSFVWDGVVSRRVMNSHRESSTRVWQEVLFKPYYRRGHRAAAIIFSVTHNYWPAQLYVSLKSSCWQQWLEPVSEVCPLAGVVQYETWVDAHYPPRLSGEAFCQAFWNREFERWPWSAQFSVANERVVGKILNVLLKYHVVREDYESLEIIFPRRIRNDLIERTVPMYRTSADATRRRQTPWQWDS